MRLLPVPRFGYTDAVHVPTLGDAVPTRGNRLTRAIGRFLLALRGWRFEGEVPNRPKMVLVVAPHTSNVDFFVGIAVLFALAIRVSFLAKHTIFWEPFGTYMRWLGGVPIDRRAAHGTVGEVQRAFETNEQFLLGITPEGTRARAPRWKMGFYHIARAAEVPIFPVAFDFGTRTVRLGRPFMPSGRVDADMQRLAAFYDGVQGANPAQFTPPVAAERASG